MGRRLLGPVGRSYRTFLALAEHHGLSTQVFLVVARRQTLDEIMNVPEGPARGGTVDVETWVSPKGVICTLHYVGGVDDWYAEAPGQRPPACYEMRSENGAVIDSFCVFPVEPWSAYDAASDRLTRDRWINATEYPDPGLCEHGLSAALCVGPQHYPLD